MQLTYHKLNMSAISRSLKTQAGVTLIEVLVSILLMSIALLGLASMQANAVASQISSSTRANVADLVTDITDRLRANLPNVPGYSAATPTTFTYTQTWTIQNSGTIAAPSKDCILVTCSSTDRADYDLLTWQSKVRKSLPQGSILISGDINAGMDVSLIWFDKEYKSGTSNDLRTSDTCTAADVVSQRQVCCPAVASVPVGVRCFNFRFLP
jgi:type IV pilus assembly protein PilV